MSDNDKMAMIVGQMVQDSANGHEDFEPKAKAVFKAARANGLVTDEDTQFRGGVIALLIAYTDDEEMTERIVQEMQALSSLSAMLGGVPVDMSRMEPPEKPLRLMKLWHESKGDR